MYRSNISWSLRTLWVSIRLIVLRCTIWFDVVRSEGRMTLRITQCQVNPPSASQAVKYTSHCVLGIWSCHHVVRVYTTWFTVLFRICVYFEERVSLCHPDRDSWSLPLLARVLGTGNPCLLLYSRFVYTWLYFLNVFFRTVLCNIVRCLACSLYDFPIGSYGIITFFGCPQVLWVW